MMWDIGGAPSHHGSAGHTPMRMPSPSVPAVAVVPELVHDPSGLNYVSVPMGHAPSSHSAYSGHLTVPAESFVTRAISEPEHQHHDDGHRHRRYSNPPELDRGLIPKAIIIKSSHGHHRSHSHSTPHHHSSHHHSHHHSLPAIQLPAPAPVSHHHLHKPHPSVRPRIEHPSYHPNFLYSKCTGRKKALCIGVNYRGESHELRGCINDAKHMRDFLVRYHGYKYEDIVLLTDDSANPRHLPTRRNMIEAMHWLVQSARCHDSLFFHYSGHGGQTRDTDGDEIDGLDEVIFPVDFKRHGHIVDDEMHDIMVKPLPAGCRLTALFDSCHSGTVLDLPFIYSSHGRLKGSQVSHRALARKSTPADVISFSACKDGQKSTDTFKGGVAVGAMSYSFISSMRNNPRQSYQQLLKSVRDITYPKYHQTPQLGSSHHIDTNLRFVI